MRKSITFEMESEDDHDKKGFAIKRSFNENNQKRLSKKFFGLGTQKFTLNIGY